MCYLMLTGIAPHDRLTWFLEIAPILIALPVIFFSYHTFPLTKVAYYLIFIHAIILMHGGEHTYALAPIGFWLQEAFELARNPYDRIGHLAQGFIPVIIAREILLRRSPLKPGKWLAFISICFCLAFSAFYEIIEWWAAISLDQSAEAFLGTQGDPWDTQWDMFLALCGACLSLILLSRLHDQQLAKLIRNT
ncbi:MAG: DUF2238 domain-containing protein [Rhodospirillales bacterium]|nr:DUF2238 domain-containing protein [Rhodospirillales bacterium]